MQVKIRLVCFVFFVWCNWDFVGFKKTANLSAVRNCQQGHVVLLAKLVWCKFYANISFSVFTLNILTRRVVAQGEFWNKASFFTWGFPSLKALKKKLPVDARINEVG